MKETEIQVGDWVRLRYINQLNNQVVIRTFKVHQIRISVFGRYEVWSKERGNMGDLDRLEPIPLTPEILKKNGFEENEFFSELKIGEEWRILCDGRNVAIFHGEHVNYDNPVCYVHELQHALRQCHIEKEIFLC